MGEKRRLGLQFIASLVLATFVSLCLFGYGAWHNHSLDYIYLPWNLFLAWIPLLLAVWLAKILRRKLWSSWGAMIVSLLWLGFLPNSFYMISDFIHLQDVQTVDVLYDAVMFASFIFTGVVLGMSSLYLVHIELRRRFRTFGTGLAMVLILLLCSFAIYIGRDLRWNTWDVLITPASLLVDVSQRLLYPTEYPQMFLTVGSFFVLFGSIYTVIWHSTRLLKVRERNLL
jgi:uncharacterized membrane protein